MLQTAGKIGDSFLCSVTVDVSRDVDGNMGSATASEFFKIKK